jgi:hypothetical protein
VAAVSGLVVFFAVILSLGPLVSDSFVAVILTMLVSAVLGGFVIIFMLYEVRQ